MAISLEPTYVERLEELASAVGILLDGGEADKTDAMDDVISAYDRTLAPLD